MVGDPADAIIADAYAFGARDFDTAHALDAMEREANQPNNVRPGLSTYDDKGYLPMDSDYGCCNFYGPVSTQQEYNTADYAICVVRQSPWATPRRPARSPPAPTTGRTSSTRPPATCRPSRPAGSSPPASPRPSSTGFVEGTSAQYTPMEPFDIAGAGRGRRRQRRLDRSKLDGADCQASTTPSPTTPTSATSRASRSRGSTTTPGAVQDPGRRCAQTQQQIFTDAPAGIAGNDDLGAMSAWYVWSALGFYPETPGHGRSRAGQPDVPAGRRDLANGKTLTITGAGRRGDCAVRARALTLNGIVVGARLPAAEPRGQGRHG